MTRKTKFVLLLSSAFLAVVGIFTTVFIFILQDNALSENAEIVDAATAQSSYGILSSGDLLSLVLLLGFTAIFLYFIFKA